MADVFALTFPTNHPAVNAQAPVNGPIPELVPDEADVADLPNICLPSVPLPVVERTVRIPKTTDVFCSVCL